MLVNVVVDIAIESSNWCGFPLDYKVCVEGIPEEIASEDEFLEDKLKRFLEDNLGDHWTESMRDYISGYIDEDSNEYEEEMEAAGEYDIKEVVYTDTEDDDGNYDDILKWG